MFRCPANQATEQPNNLVNLGSRGHTGGVFFELRGFAARLILQVDLEGQDALVLAVGMPEVLGRPK